jgi:hypothetical protein
MAKKPTVKTNSEMGNVQSPTSILTIRNGKNLLKFLGVFMLLLIPFVGKAVGGKMAALYLLGNDGKISGRTSGDVYMSNGRKRRFVIPAVVRNAYTSGVRGIFSTFSSMWGTLSTFEQLTWLNYNTTKVDRFKQNVTIKGKAAFVQLNANARNVGAMGIVNPAPVGAVTPAAISLSPPSIVVSTTTFDFNYVTDANALTVLISATVGFGTGVFRPSKSAYRNISVQDLTSAGPINIWHDYIVKFGIPVAGSRIFISVKSIDQYTGLASAVTEIFGTVVA